MNVILVSEEYAPHIGGGGVVVANLAREFKKRGHSVTIIAALYPRNLKAKEIIGGIEVRRMHFLFPYRPISNIIKFFFIFPITIFGLLRIIILKKCDVVNIHFITPKVLLPVLFLKKIMRFPLVASVHGDDIIGVPYKSAVNKWFVTKGLKKPEFITCNSAFLLNKIKKLTLNNTIRLEIIRNGINLKEFVIQDKFNHSLPYIFAIGRLVYRKGFDVLVKAFQTVASKIDQVDLIISGDGPERESCSSLARELGIEYRVRFMGYTDRRETVRLFKGSRFFVLPSRVEALGITNLEAMAAGKAIIGTRVGGVPEIVRNGYNGLLVEPEDPRALASGILRLLENPSLAEELGQNGRRHVEDCYSWENGARHYLEVYRIAMRSVGREVCSCFRNES